jgi:uncharacterized surface anchored protein
MGYAIQVTQAAPTATAPATATAAPTATAEATATAAPTTAPAPTATTLPQVPTTGAQQLPVTGGPLDGSLWALLIAGGLVSLVGGVFFLRWAARYNA